MSYYKSGIMSQSVDSEEDHEGAIWDRATDDFPETNTSVLSCVSHNCFDYQHNIIILNIQSENDRDFDGKRQ